MTALVLACTIAVGVVLLLASLHDISVRTVPNTLALALAALGLVMASVQHRLPGSCLVALLVLVLAGLATARGMIGGGDAKLLAASALVLAPWQVPAALLATALAGGLLALPYLPGRKLFRRPPPGRPVGTLARLLRCERWRLSRRGPLPYAVAIAAGTLFVLLHRG